MTNWGNWEDDERLSHPHRERKMGAPLSGIFKMGNDLYDRSDACGTAFACHTFFVFIIHF